LNIPNIDPNNGHVGLGETLIIQDFEAKIILLKMWFFLIISLTTLEVIGEAEFS